MDGKSKTGKETVNNDLKESETTVLEYRSDGGIDRVHALDGPKWYPASSRPSAYRESNGS